LCIVQLRLGFLGQDFRTCPAYRQALHEHLYFGATSIAGCHDGPFNSLWRVDSLPRHFSTVKAEGRRSRFRSSTNRARANSAVGADPIPWPSDVLWSRLVRAISSPPALASLRNLRAPRPHRFDNEPEILVSGQKEKAYGNASFRDLLQYVQSVHSWHKIVDEG